MQLIVVLNIIPNSILNESIITTIKGLIFLKFKLKYFISFLVYSYRLRLVRDFMNAKYGITLRDEELPSSPRPISPGARLLLSVLSSSSSMPQ